MRWCARGRGGAILPYSPCCNSATAVGLGLQWWSRGGHVATRMAAGGEEGPLHREDGGWGVRRVVRPDAPPAAAARQLAGGAATAAPHCGRDRRARCLRWDQWDQLDRTARRDSRRRACARCRGAGGAGRGRVQQPAGGRAEAGLRPAAAASTADGRGASHTNGGGAASAPRGAAADSGGE